MENSHPQRPFLEQQFACPSVWARAPVSERPSGRLLTMATIAPTEAESDSAHSADLIPDAELIDELIDECAQEAPKSPTPVDSDLEEEAYLDARDYCLRLGCIYTVYHPNAACARCGRLFWCYVRDKNEEESQAWIRPPEDWEGW